MFKQQLTLYFNCAFYTMPNKNQEKCRCTCLCVVNICVVTSWGIWLLSRQNAIWCSFVICQQFWLLLEVCRSKFDKIPSCTSKIYVYRVIRNASGLWIRLLSLHWIVPAHRFLLGQYDHCNLTASLSSPPPRATTAVNQLLTDDSPAQDAGDGHPLTNRVGYNRCNNQQISSCPWIWTLESLVKSAFSQSWA